MKKITIRPISAEEFAPFGELLVTRAQASKMINAGRCERHHALATVERGGGEAIISIFRSEPVSLPYDCALLERHPLGSQAFVPLSKTPYLIVVSESPQHAPRCFKARDGAGVNYRRGVWHHPLLALEQESEFLIVDRIGNVPNCEEAALPQAWVIPAL